MESNPQTPPSNILPLMRFRAACCECYREGTEWEEP